MTLTFVTGGARSGKSTLRAAPGGGERRAGRADRHGGGAGRGDAERIAAHRAERPAAWRTVEEPLDLAAALRGLAAPEFAIVDCLSLWVSNRLEASGAGGVEALAAEAAALAAAHAGGCVAVSNEVGMGIVPANALARTYRDVLGRVNAIWADAAGDACSPSPAASSGWSAHDVPARRRLMVAAVRTELRATAAAVTLLTRVPLGDRVVVDEGDIARALAWLPLVGAGLGGAVALVARGLSGRLDAGPAAVLIVAGWALATGAIHLDGLADSADSLGVRERERRLAVMRDPRLGSFGVLALVFVVALKIALVAAVLERGHNLWLLAIPAVARASASALSAGLRTRASRGRAQR